MGISGNINITRVAGSVADKLMLASGFCIVLASVGISGNIKIPRAAGLVADKLILASGFW